MKKTVLFFVFLISIVLQVKSGVVNTSISAFGDYDMKGKKFCILSGIDDVKSNDLEFISYANIIKQCLIAKKAIPVEIEDNPEVFIYLNYGIHDYSHDNVSTEDTYGMTQTTTTVVTPNITTGSLLPYGKKSNVYMPTTTTINSYSWGKTGEKVTTKHINEYHGDITLQAYNSNSPNNSKMLWKIKANCSSQIGSLNNVISYMAHSMINYIGTTTTNEINEVIMDNDFEAMLLKENVYLKENVIVNPLNNYDAQREIELKCVVLEEGETSILLMAKKSKLVKSLKFTNETFLDYNGKRYQVTAINTPEKKVINKTIRLKDYPTYVYFEFPVSIKKGEKFNIIGYYIKTEDEQKSKEISIDFSNILLE